MSTTCVNTYVDFILIHHDVNTCRFISSCPTHFESIRLFLSQYGFCSLNAMDHLLHGKSWTNTHETTYAEHYQPRIQLLNSNDETFLDELRKLDQISPTLYCTGQIYYLKCHQQTLLDNGHNLVCFYKRKSCFCVICLSTFDNRTRPNN
jgi:hypothetical protein